MLNSIKAAGLNVNVINIMAMDYGPANDNGGQMGLSAVQAASNTHNQVVAAGLTGQQFRLPTPCRPVFACGIVQWQYRRLSSKTSGIELATSRYDCKSMPRLTHLSAAQQGG